MWTPSVYYNRDNQAHRDDAPGREWISPSDVTNGVLRPTDQGRVLHGVEPHLKFLDRHLLPQNRGTSSMVFLPRKRTLLLYGREGIGKTTLLHSGCHSYLNKEAFSRVRDFRLQHWNMDAFVTWTRECLDDLHNMRYRCVGGGEEAPPPASLLIIIGNLHKFNYVRGGDPLNALLHLLSAVRLFHDGSRVRLLMLCDETPGQFPQDLLQLIDVTHYMPPPGPDTCMAILRDWMHHFALFLHGNSNMEYVKWDLDLDDVLDNSSHILYTLVVASRGCTPREMVTFLRRSFDGVCSYGSRETPTTYCAGWLESLLYKVDGALNSLIPVNSDTLNGPLNTYAGLLTEDPLIGAKTCFVRQVPDMVQRLAPTPDAEPSGPSKRPRVQPREPDGAAAAAGPVEQPKSVREALEARLEEQRQKQRTAARAEASKRRRRGDDNELDD
jgi:hypothetical protein